MREGGGKCLKYLKRGWNRTEGREHKDFKKGAKLGQGVGALKRGGGLEPPYELRKGICDKRFIWNPSNCEYVINSVILVCI